MRILIVEDDSKLAAQLKKGLEEHGHSVVLTFDGRDGLYAAENDIFDILVVDVMLPGLDGFSIVRGLRKQQATTPILLLTARDSAEDIVTGLDAGADDYLTKPFSFKVLSARLRALGAAEAGPAEYRLAGFRLIVRRQCPRGKAGLDRCFANPSRIYHAGVTDA